MIMKIKLFAVFQLLSAYLAFCGIAIHNAQIFEAYSKEYDRNKVSKIAFKSTLDVSKSKLISNY